MGLNRMCNWNFGRMELDLDIRLNVQWGLWEDGIRFRNKVRCSENKLASQTFYSFRFVVH